MGSHALHWQHAYDLAEQQHQAQPTPDQGGNPTIEAAAVILATAATTAIAIAGLARLLRAPKPIVGLALTITSRVSAHRPRKVASDTGPAVTATRQAELYYRAAYIVAAVARIRAGLDQGLTVQKVVQLERRNVLKHEQARRNRMDSARKVDEAAAFHNSNLLGWYLSPNPGKNTPECIAASRGNFRVDQKPFIGWPGSVHPYCGCYAGPPKPGAKSVDALTHGMLITATKKRVA